VNLATGQAAPVPPELLRWRRIRVRKHRSAVRLLTFKV
jgi:hypothetical protein